MRFESLDQWLTWQESFHPRSIDLGLSRVRSVYEKLDSSREQPLTITVAGTNGKGSCIAFFASILRAEGYRVGAYTSPHLLRYNERIQIDGEAIDDSSLCQAFERVDRVRGDTSLTYFEFGTLAALDLFRRADLDIQLLEVGLGGRLDAVNVIDADSMLVTCIEIDHVDWLGESREAIGLEKAGILRTGISAVIGEKAPPDSILSYAADNKIPLHRLGHEYDYQVTDSGWNWNAESLSYRDLPFPALQGEHQLQNAASVLQTLHLVRDRCPVSEESVRAGLESVRLAGRFQYISGAPSVLLDVAHNPQAAGTLATYLREFFSGRRIVAVYSAMVDKDIMGVIESLSPLVDHWIFAPLSNPRCVPEGEIVRVFSACGIDRFSLGFEDAESAFGEAGKRASIEDLVLVFGSFFLVAEFLKNVGRYRQSEELSAILQK